MKRAAYLNPDQFYSNFDLRRFAVENILQDMKQKCYFPI